MLRRDIKRHGLVIYSHQEEASPPDEGTSDIPTPNSNTLRPRQE